MAAPRIWPCPFQFRSIEVIGAIHLPHQGACCSPPPTGLAGMPCDPRALAAASVGVIAVSWVTRTESGIQALVSATAGCFPLTRGKAMEPPHCATRVDLLAAGQQLVVFPEVRPAPGPDRSARPPSGLARLAVLGCQPGCGGSGLCLLGLWLQASVRPERPQPCGPVFWLPLLHVNGPGAEASGEGPQ